MPSHLAQEYFEFMVDSSCGYKRSPNHHSSTTMLDSWYEAFVLICFVWFSPTIEYGQTFRSLVQMPLFKQERANLPCSFQRDFLHGSLPNKPYFLSLFLIVLSQILIFNMLIEACRVQGVPLGSDIRHKEGIFKNLHMSSDQLDLSVSDRIKKFEKPIFSPNCQRLSVQFSCVRYAHL